MIEMNGWAVINESYVWDDSLNDKRELIVTDIQAHINHSVFNEIIDLEYLNGIPVLHIALQHNHYTQSIDDIVDLLRYIANVAPGSYGQVHLYDDESHFGDSNVMYVYVLCRGELIRRIDPFFTPYIPNVEGPDPDSQPLPVSTRIPKYLPIGSIVVLKGGEKKLMIFGRYQQDTANDTVFDYVGCPYPEGNIGTKATFLFNHEDIAWIHWLGMSDEEDEALNDELKQLPRRVNSLKEDKPAA